MLAGLKMFLRSNKLNKAFRIFNESSLYYPRMQGLSKFLLISDMAGKIAFSNNLFRIAPVFE